jgi:hypothetical protein
VRSEELVAAVAWELEALSLGLSRMAAARGGLARLLAAAAVCVLWAAAVEARSPAAMVHRHLKRLNKPAVKSIEVVTVPELKFPSRGFSYFVVASKLCVDALSKWEFGKLRLIRWEVIH